MAKKKNLSEALTFPVVKYLKAMVKLGRMEVEHCDGTANYTPTSNFKPMTEEELSQFCPEAGVMLTKKLQEDGYWCVIS